MLDPGRSRASASAGFWPPERRLSAAAGRVHGRRLLLGFSLDSVEERSHFRISNGPELDIYSKSGVCKYDFIHPSIHPSHTADVYTRECDFMTFEFYLRICNSYKLQN